MNRRILPRIFGAVVLLAGLSGHARSAPAPRRVRNINLHTLGSDPTAAVVAGGAAWLVADDGLVGPELWKTDGSALLADPGRDGDLLRHDRRFGDRDLEERRHEPRDVAGRGHRGRPGIDAPAAADAGGRDAPLLGGRRPPRPRALGLHPLSRTRSAARGRRCDPDLVAVFEADLHASELARGHAVHPAQDVRAERAGFLAEQAPQPGRPSYADPSASRTVPSSTSRESSPNQAG